MPPTNPTLPLLDAMAAAIPTRNDPSCSLKTIDWTFGSVHDRVDDGELEVGELLGDLLHAGGLGEADAHDDLGAAPRHVAERLLALGLVGHLELAVRDAGFLLEALGAGEGGLVEGLVELPAHVEHDGRSELLGRGRTGQRDGGEHEDEQDESPRLIHGQRPPLSSMKPVVRGSPPAPRGRPAPR